MQRRTMTAKQAANYLGVSYWKLLDLVKKGQIRHIKIGKKLLFTEERVWEFIEKCESKSIKTEEGFGD